MGMTIGTLAACRHVSKRLGWGRRIALLPSVKCSGALVARQPESGQGVRNFAWTMVWRPAHSTNGGRRAALPRDERGQAGADIDAGYDV